VGKEELTVSRAPDLSSEDKVEPNMDRGSNRDRPRPATTQRGGSEVGLEYGRTSCASENSLGSECPVGIEGPVATVRQS
jgi:hypothetical protein